MYFNSRCEKKKAHNNIEKKRKDKLKIAIDDLRKFLPALITKNIKMVRLIYLFAVHMLLNVLLYLVSS